jgi:hypothetical protein
MPVVPISGVCVAIDITTIGQVIRFAVRARNVFDLVSSKT